MVVIDDFRKQILYQRLNLGYECSFCKKKFYSKREQLQHLQEFHLKRQKKGHFECSKCGKVFNHVHIYQLHQQIHALSEADTNNLANSKNEQQVAGKFPTVPKKSALQPTSAKHKQKMTAKRAVGLTKIRMEDCLRCDECSCIYIDRNDYYKHMRNFHKVNINVSELSVTSGATSASVKNPLIAFDPIPAKSSQSPKMCKSCCKHCRDNQFSKEKCRHHLFHRADKIRTNSIELFRFSMQDNIKNRWSKMVSQRLLETKEPQCEDLEIKPDPDATEAEPSYCSSVIDSEEMSHLLSQVEVKIKTEPPDDR